MIGPASRRWVLAGALALSAAPVWPQRLVVEGDVVHTMGPAGTLRPGVVLIDEGRIIEVGPVARVRVPRDWERLAAPVVTPGLIDAHSVVGLAGQYNVPADQDEDEPTDPNQADLRAIDGFNPAEPLLDYLLRFGVTVIQSGPGRMNPIGGQAGVFKTSGRTVEEMTLRFPSAVVFTLGEAPKAAYRPKDKPPATRMATAALIRRALAEARAYDEKRREAGEPAEEARKPPDRDLKKEALAAVVRGDVPALFTAHREDDILTALRIGREFGLKLLLDAATEGYLVRDEILNAGVPVIVHPTMQRLAGPETLNTTMENAALLAEVGIPIAIQSGFESYVPKTRVVTLEAAVAMANGLGPDRALAAITIDAARILGVDDRVGSLEPGKDGDVALFDGDPFEFTSHVQAVVMNGRVVARPEF